MYYVLPGTFLNENLSWIYFVFFLFFSLCLPIRATRGLETENKEEKNKREIDDDKKLRAQNNVDDFFLCECRLLLPPFVLFFPRCSVCDIVKKGTHQQIFWWISDFCHCLILALCECVHAYIPFFHTIRNLSDFGKVTFFAFGFVCRFFPHLCRSLFFVELLCIAWSLSQSECFVR